MMTDAEGGSPLNLSITTISVELKCLFKQTLQLLRFLFQPFYAVTYIGSPVHCWKGLI